MLFEEALYNYLSTYSGLISLVTSGAVKKIFPVTAPEGTTVPYVTYTQISGFRYAAFKTDPGMTNPTYQFSCYGGTYAASKNVAAQIRAALQDLASAIGGVGGYTVQATLIVDENDLYDQQAKEFYTVLDIQFFFNE